MRRRRKFKGTWFPLYGTEMGPEGTEVTGQGLNADGILTPADGGIVTIITRLTADEPLEDADAHALTDIVGNNEYALRRIVGKLQIAFAGLQGEDPAVTTANLFTAKIAAGFFVARADDQDSTFPLGAGSRSFDSTADLDATNSFSPLATRTMREPWIWRRTWILGNPVTFGVAPAVTGAYLPNPSNNSQCGSVLDGPHIDAKTRRRVRGDERLYFAISAANWPYSTSPDTDAQLAFSWDLDVRLFGAMRRARNRGAF